MALSLQTSARVEVPGRAIARSHDDPLIGQLVAGRYLVRRRLATGGMCAIYELGHRALNRRFALKILSPETANDPDSLVRFWREAEMVAGLCHPNIVSILDWDQLADGTPFLVMELLDGEDLHDRIQRVGALPLGEVARIADEVLAGLTVAHRAGIVHRDLKPSNIFLARDDAGGERAVLLDFGISKLRGVETQAGEHSLVGTPLYMAPEQMDPRLAPVGPASDVWAMGAIIYEMATGERAFDGASLVDIVRRVCHERPIPLGQLRADAPRALELLIEHALDSDAARRPADAAALRSELELVSELCADQSVTDVEISLAPTPAIGPAAAPAPAPASDSQRPTVPTALFTLRRARRRWIAPMVTVLVSLAAAVALALVLPGGSRRSVAAPARIATSSGKPLRLAVTSTVSPARLAAQYTPVRRYLEQALGVPIELLVVHSHGELSGRVVRGEVDIAWLPALEYVRATGLDPGLHPLAVPVERANTNHYQGVILAMKGRGLEDLGDLVGRTFCYIDPTSASGYLYPREVMRRAGLDPDTAFREAEFLNEHSQVLASLESGRCDAAATYEGILRGGGEHGFRPDRFAILATTGPIPYGPFVATGRMPREQAAAIRRALLALQPGTEASRAVFGGQGEFAGFEPADPGLYEALRRQTQAVVTALPR
jgi:phosphate/phosphite/phosphonate ABC transporter binding protein